MVTFSQSLDLPTPTQPVSSPLLSAWRILVHIHLKGKGNSSMKFKYVNDSEVSRETTFPSDNRSSSLLPSLISLRTVLSCFFPSHPPKYKVGSLFKHSSSLDVNARQLVIFCQTFKNEKKTTS